MDSVSGLHARLEKRDGQLYVTDLDSTNGTYVDDKRVRPGAVTPVFPGSYVTFG
jgi:pSer/pThr/pTyr-binding forkhead associated (FHA) protein